MDNLNVSGVYKIVNIVTNECYVGSSRNIYRRWYSHRAPSTWAKYPDRPLYKAMQKYGVDKFRTQILVPVMEEYLKQVEQELIEMLHPAYNSNNANGQNIERYKEADRQYRQSDEYKERHEKYYKEYSKNYFNQTCLYKGKTLTLKALLRRFQRAKIPHATLEAKKYLVTTIQSTSNKI